MSRHDEFKDLEKRLRQARPSTEPLPPAWKRDLRAQLMEKATMNQEKFNPGRLFAAAGALVLLVAIPLFFWIGQSSLNQNQPMSPGIVTETETPTATTEETTAVPEATFTVPPTGTPYAFAWIVSMDPAPGTTLTPQDAVNVTVGYDLQSVVAEAQLLVKLVTDENEGVGVGTGETAVSQNRGTATISVPLENLEVLADGDEVSLQLMLANDGDERLLYLDMPENMSWSVNTTYAEAAIVSVGEPRLFQPPGDAPSEMTFYEVDIVTEYTLTGYEKAVLVINAEHQVPGAGSSVTSNSLTIQEGSSTSTSTMIFAEDYFDENGVLLPDTTITAMINLYDEETSTYTNLYPGDVELPPEMASAPPPISPDRIRIDAITLADPLLNISLNYNLESSPTATLTLDSTAATAVAAVEPIPVSAGEDSMTLSMPADSLQSGTPLTLTAVLEGDNVSANDVLTLRLSDFENDTLDDLWIAHVNVITDTTVPAFNAMLEITLGYNLNETFSDGEIRYSVRSLSNNANGGGGGGGGGWPIPTGLGVVTIPLFVPLPEDDANVSISLQFELTGTAVTDTGTETQTLTTLTPSLDELLPDN